MLTQSQLALVDALERRKLLACVGPSVTTAAGLPGLRALVERCRQALAEAGYAAQLPAGAAEALEQAEHALRQARFVRLVRAAWEPTGTPSASLCALVRLSRGLNAIVTTNLDRTIEHAFAGCWPTIAEAAPDVASSGLPDAMALQGRGTRPSVPRPPAPTSH